MRHSLLHAPAELPEPKAQGSSQEIHISLGKNWGGNIVTGSLAAGGSLMDSFGLTISVFRVPFFGVFVIFGGIDFIVFSLAGNLTPRESAPRRNGIPWIFTSACLDWKL